MSCSYGAQGSFREILTSSLPAYNWFLLFYLLLIFSHAYSYSAYPDPSLSLSFISQRSNLSLVAFSLLVPGFVHLYPHTYFFYHFLSRLDFVCCYWYSYWGAADLASFHSQKNPNYSPPIFVRSLCNSPLSTWEVQAWLTVLSVTTFSFLLYLQCSELLVVQDLSWSVWLSKPQVRAYSPVGTPEQTAVTGGVMLTEDGYE